MRKIVITEEELYSIIENVITELTKRINGGTNGLDDRIKYTVKFGKILGVISNG